MYWGWTIKWDKERRRPKVVRWERSRLSPLARLGLMLLGLIVLAILLTVEPLGGW